MKTPASVLAVMCAVALTVVPANGQITITSANVSAEFAVGKVIVNHNDTTTVSLNIGAPGSTSWDFSGLPSHTTTSLTSVAVGSSPFAGNFSGATHVVSTPVTLFGIATTGYQYLTIGTNVLNLGSGAPILAPPIINSGSALITNSPVEELYALPSTLGSTWTSAFTATTSVTINGSPVTPTTAAHNYAYTVDAFGLMKMPGGATSAALRIKKVESASPASVSYIFLSADGASVRATAADVLQPTSGVISVVRSSISWTAADPSLPIQLASFRASVVGNGGGVELRWTTLSEIQNYGFNLQRRPGTSGDFVTIPGSFVPGHGTTVQPQSYTYLDASAPAELVEYRLAQVDRDGSVHYSEPIQVNAVTDVKSGTSPVTFSVRQNYPNPFNPSTRIQFNIETRDVTTLKVFDLLGREVAELVNGTVEAGVHEVIFDASGLASGTYVYRLSSGPYVETRKMTLIR